MFYGKVGIRWVHSIVDVMEIASHAGVMLTQSSIVYLLKWAITGMMSSHCRGCFQRLLCSEDV